MSPRDTSPSFARLAAIVRCVRGIAAVEFALIAPVILIMLIAAIEMSRAISMDRRLSTVSSMIGDLISREKNLGSNPATTIAGMTRAIEHVMAPYDPSSLRLEIFPVMGFGEDGAQTKLYAPSYTYDNGSVAQDRARCTTYSLPTGLVGQGGSVIVVKATYRYETPTFATSLLSDATWHDGSTHSPRHACVDFEANNCVVTCN